MVTMIKKGVETRGCAEGMVTMIKGGTETMKMWGEYGYHDKGRGDNHENVGRVRLP
jgi:hypothetical protein